MSIPVNGSPTEEFRLERGVRQGDSLLPFLFILATEGLNTIVTEAVEKGIFKGVVVGENKVSISHLQYADDTIFFGEWNKENAKTLMCILKCFEESFGLKVNYSKSKVYGIDVTDRELLDMARWMGCGIGDFLFTYLGLLIRENMRRVKAWSSSMSIPVNGSPTEEFRLERGVRQGDSLLPFLFILATEGLNTIVTEAVEKGIFKGVVVGENKVSISHLQYADDTIFFGEWNKENAKTLMYILKCFEESFGLKVNYSKSKVYGIDVTERELSDMARWMGRGIGDFLFTYLGLLIRENMRRVKAWCTMEEKFKNRLGIGRQKRRYGMFSVKELARLIEEKVLRVESDGEETIWNNLVPKKLTFSFGGLLEEDFRFVTKFSNVEVGDVNFFTIGEIFVNGGGVHVPTF
nr:putative RNA-directed DNA polymerase, eukaryota, reverse transcriptase zinc-binding domain protein [Tanacetum cinerariifolium]